MNNVVKKSRAQEIYYEQLHDTSRTYQTMIWAVPGIFILLQATLFGAIKFDDFGSLRNFLLFFCDFVFSLSLWLQFQKTYMAALLLQDQIDEIDEIINNRDKNTSFPIRMPMYSVKDLFERMEKWNKKEKEKGRIGLCFESRLALWFSSFKWFKKEKKNGGTEHSKPQKRGITASKVIAWTMIITFSLSLFLAIIILGRVFYPW